MSAAPALRHHQRMLPTVWTLRDVADVESLVRGVAAELVGKTRSGVPEADYDELVAALFEQVVVLDRRFDSERVGILFRPWLYVQLRRRAIDFLRSWRGRKGEKAVVRAESADAGDPREDRLEPTLSEGDGVAADDRPSSFGGLLHCRDRSVAWERRRMGQGKDQRAPRRDHEGARAD